MGTIEQQKALALADAQIKLNQKSKSPGKVTGTVRAGLQGATFGLSDEVGAMVAAIPASFATDEKVMDVYSKMHKNLQGQREAFSKENPGLALGAEIAGGVLTGGAGASKALASQTVRNASKLGKVGAVSGVGAVEGAIYGAGQANQDERLSGAATGGALGAVAAPLGAGAINTLGKVAGGATNYAADKLGKTAKGQAKQVLRDTADAIGMTGDEAAASVGKLGKDAAIVDLDDAFRVVARAGMNRQGTMRQTGKDFAYDRQRGQQQRLMTAIEATSGDSSAYRGTLAGITAKRAREAAPLYQEAMDQGVEMSAKITPLLDDPLMKKSIKIGKDWAESDGDPNNLLKILHEAKQHLDDRIGAAIRKGKGNEARKLMTKKEQLLDAIGEQNPTYIKAKDTFAGASALKDALETGRTIFKQDPEELAARLATMSDGEKELVRLGGVKAVSNILDGTGRSRDALRKITDSPINEKRLAIVLGDDASGFLKRAGIEEEFSQTKGMLTGNSTTELQQQAGKSLDQSIEPGWGNAIRNANPGNLIANVVDVVSKSKASPEVINELGDMLFKKGLSAKQVKNIFETPAIRRAFGDDYDRLVAPYVQSATAPAALAGMDQG